MDLATQLQGKRATVNSVAYVLRGDGQRIVIKGRGAVGRSVRPNIFDDMSRELVSAMAGR